MWLTLIALRNRIGILMLSLAMVVLGATSLSRLPVDLFPQIQVPIVFVGVIYKGAPLLDLECRACRVLCQAGHRSRSGLVQLGRGHQRRPDGSDAASHPNPQPTPAG